jgi:pimeloyl-ACP methyl ester carboxylesterase
MRAVFARALTIGAALAYAVAVAMLVAAERRVAHYGVTLSSGAPAVVYEPGVPPPFGPPEHESPLPVVVLAHGFSGSKQMMSSLARRIARAGYAVVAFDFRGHGSNRQPFERALGGASDALAADVDAAVLFARTESRFDGTRVALAGHSMGAAAVLAYATREPNVAAVIAISGVGALAGPYPPPNALLLWGSRELGSLRERGRATAAKLAGVEQVVLDRDYGDPERGTAVRASELDGLDHLTILWSGDTAARIVGWLERTLGPGEHPAAEGFASDGRFGPALLGLLAWLVLALRMIEWIAPLVPRTPLPETTRPLGRIGLVALALVAGALLVAGADPRADGSALSFVPVLVGRDLAALFLASGVLLSLALARRGALPFTALRAPRTWLAALAIAGFAYASLGAFSQPVTDLWLAPHRALAALTCATAALPFFASTEWLLRGPGRIGVWLPIAGKLVTLAVIATAATMGVLSFLILLGIGAFILSFALLEVLAWRLSRAAPNPWVPALVQSLWAGWTLAATFPAA